MEAQGRVEDVIVIDSSDDESDAAAACQPRDCVLVRNQSLSISYSNLNILCYCSLACKLDSSVSRKFLEFTEKIIHYRMP